MKVIGPHSVQYGERSQELSAEDHRQWGSQALHWRMCSLLKPFGAMAAAENSRTEELMMEQMGGD